MVTMEMLCLFMNIRPYHCSSEKGSHTRPSPQPIYAKGDKESWGGVRGAITFVRRGNGEVETFHYVN